MSKQPLMIDVDRGMYIDIPRWKSREQIKALERQWRKDPVMKLYFKGIRGRKAYLEFTSPEQRERMINVMAASIERQGNATQRVGMY